MSDRPESRRPTMRRLIAPLRNIAVAAIVAVLAGAVPTVFKADAATVSINVGNFYFCSPAFQNGICDTNVNRGDTVMWNWVGGTHNVAECGVNWSKGSSCTGADFVSPTQSSGSFSRLFAGSAGTTYYRCTVHPAAMRGRIIVGDPDADGDGWSSYLEGLIGTDAGAACPSSTSHNAWPADIDNNGVSDITDISALAGSFNRSVSQVPVRHDIAPDPPNGVVDITDISRIAGLFGKPCPAP